MDALLNELLEGYLGEIGETIEKVETCTFTHETDESDGDVTELRTKPSTEEAEEARQSLLRRWGQIQEAVNDALVILKKWQVEPVVTD